MYKRTLDIEFERDRSIGFGQGSSTRGLRTSGELCVAREGYFTKQCVMNIEA